MIRIPGFLRPTMVAAVLALSGPASISAQASFTACYVPTVGAIYLTGLTGLPSSCLATSHVAISWQNGALADGSVTAVKLADGSVTTVKITDAAVTAAKLGFDPATQAELDAFAAQLKASGTVNTGANPVDWSQLKNVPAGFADGSDDGSGGGGSVTSITAGAGLSGGTITTSGQIDVAFAGTGAASTVARSDHDHSSPVNNTAIGAAAFTSNISGVQNTALGANALAASYFGDFNTAVGSFALTANDVGSSNTAIGYRTLDANTAGLGNTAVGVNALGGNTTGGQNTAIGQSALAATTTISGNTAVGYETLTANTSGAGNTALGAQALASNTTGTSNTAVGNAALGLSAAAGENTAVGAASQAAANTGFNSSLGALSLQQATGAHNTAIGDRTLAQLTSGNNNTAIGSGAGNGLTSGSNNLYLGGGALGSESNTIRIGTGLHTRAFLDGVWGVTTGVSGAVAVVIDNNGQLGTVSSSARFKEDIHDMGDASARLLDLRPVSFRYRQPRSDGSKPIEYGLIAEEVAKAFPELVATGADGSPESVQYHILPALLLNELQRQQKEITELREAVRRLEAAK